MAKDIFVQWDRSTTQPSVKTDCEPVTARTSQGPFHLLWLNGFIANRTELIRENDLEADTADSGLLLVMVERRPEDFPRRIAGPCSYVVWDDHRKALTAVRDRSGSCDIYYRLDGAVLTLSNSVGAILDSTRETKKPNLLSVAAHLTHQSLARGATFYEGIASLPVGARLFVTQSQLQMEDYWVLQLQSDSPLRSDAEYSEEYRELLFRITREYAPVEATAGITLSSGLDSTSVAAALCACLGSRDRLRAFTWVTPNFPDADEDLPAAAVCEHLGISMERIRADLAWPLSGSSGVQTCRETPFLGFYSELWEQTLQTMQERGVGVFFSGIGGDELFGGDVFGYPDLLLKGQWGNLFRQIRAHVPHSSMSLPAILRVMVMNPIAKSFVPGVARFAQLRTTNPWLEDTVRQSARELISVTDGVSWRSLPGRQRRFVGLKRLLEYPGLSDHMRRFSVFGIEGRHPLMDHRLLEFAASLPTDQTFQAAVRKIIMRRAMQGYLPETILDSRDKIYLGSIADWGLKHEQDKVWPLLTGMRAAELGLVDELKLRVYYKDYLEGKDSAPTFWHAITLEDWLRRYF